MKCQSLKMRMRHKMTITKCRSLKKSKVQKMRVIRKSLWLQKSRRQSRLLWRKKNLQTKKNLKWVIAALKTITKFILGASRRLNWVTFKPPMNSISRVSSALTKSYSVNWFKWAFLSGLKTTKEKTSLLKFMKIAWENQSAPSTLIWTFS